MKINVGTWDRMIRFFLGVLMITWAIAGGPWWGYMGAYLLFTSGWAFCPIYAFLNIRTAPLPQRSYVPPE